MPSQGAVMADEMPPLQMRVTRHAEVAISLEDMYRLLVSVDAKVTALTVEVRNAHSAITDHEARLRDLEASRASDARVTAMEDDVKAIRAELEGLKRKVYAIPSAATAVAAIALIVTLIRWL